jgi:hypothetical protein
VKLWRHFLNFKVDAFKEAVADTAIAIVINFPLNMLLIVIARGYEMSVFTTTVFFTLVFTVVAIARKTYMRVFFEKRNRRKVQEIN